MQDKEFDRVESTADHGEGCEAAVVVGGGRRRGRQESLERLARWLARRVTGSAHRPRGMPRSCGDRVTMVDDGVGRNADLEPPRRIVPVERDAGVGADLLRLRATTIGMKPHLAAVGVKSTEHNRAGVGGASDVDGRNREEMKRMACRRRGRGKIGSYGMPDASGRLGRQTDSEGRIVKTFGFGRGSHHVGDHTVPRMGYPMNGFLSCRAKGDM